MIISIIREIKLIRAIRVIWVISEGVASRHHVHCDLFFRLYHRDISRRHVQCNLFFRLYHRDIRIIGIIGVIRVTTRVIRVTKII
jgi:hypothetical protein